MNRVVWRIFAIVVGICVIWRLRQVDSQHPPLSANTGKAGGELVRRVQDMIRTHADPRVRAMEGWARSGELMFGFGQAQLTAATTIPSPFVDCVGGRPRPAVDKMVIDPGMAGSEDPKEQALLRMVLLHEAIHVQQARAWRADSCANGVQEDVSVQGVCVAWWHREVEAYRESCAMYQPALMQEERYCEYLEEEFETHLYDHVRALIERRQGDEHAHCLPFIESLQ